MHTTVRVMSQLITHDFSMFGREPRLPIDLAFGINFHNRKQSL